MSESRPENVERGSLTELVDSLMLQRNELWEELGVVEQLAHSEGQPVLVQRARILRDAMWQQFTLLDAVLEIVTVDEPGASSRR